jgi:hypothetical protein
LQEKIADFESNLTLAENTLPGLIIAIMHKEGSPVSLNQILQFIYPRWENLRRANGSKYNVRDILTIRKILIRF